MSAPMRPISSQCPWWYDNQAMHWKYKCENSNTILSNVHAPNNCASGDQACPIHMPSEHKYRHLPQVFKGFVMYRVKPDGKMIVDPDDTATQVRPWKRRGREPYTPGVSSSASA